LEKWPSASIKRHERKSEGSDGDSSPRHVKPATPPRKKVTPGRAPRARGGEEAEDSPRETARRGSAPAKLQGARQRRRSSVEMLRQHSEVAFHDSIADGLNDVSDSDLDSDPDTQSDEGKGGDDEGKRSPERGFLGRMRRRSSVGAELGRHNSQSFHMSCTDVDLEESDYTEGVDGDEADAKDADFAKTKAKNEEDEVAALRKLAARQRAQIDLLTTDVAREQARADRLEVRNAELEADVSILAKKLTVQQKREMNLMNAMRRLQSECPTTPPTPRRMSLGQTLSVGSSERGVFNKLPLTRRNSAIERRMCGGASVMSAMTGGTDYTTGTGSEGSAADNNYDLDSPSVGGVARPFGFR